jgi:hypothetical protein
MKYLSSLAAIGLLSASAFASATTTWDLGSYTVTYDEATPGFGYLSGAFFSGGGTTGINWSFSSSVQASILGSGTNSVTFALPDFTITANAGYTLSGPLKASLGNISFFQGLGGSTSINAAGNYQVDGGPVVAAPAGALTQVLTGTSPFTVGYFADSSSAALGNFSSFTVSGASITLIASGSGPSSFASISAQPQNQFKVEFLAVAVPEPDSVALMLAGLGVLGWVARRRRA